MSISEDSLDGDWLNTRVQSPQQRTPNNDDSRSSLLGHNQTNSLRLDTEVDKPRKTLFYESSSPQLPIAKENIIPSPVRNKRFFEESDTSGVFALPKRRINGLTRRRIAKKRSNLINEWDLKSLIKSEFNEKFANDKLIENFNWRRLPNSLELNIAQLLEGNLQSSIDEVFDRYNNELTNVLQDNDSLDDISQIYQLKLRLMNEIMKKIKTNLKLAKFPDKFKEKDIDIEYIVAKRSFIQDRYVQELKNIENLNLEINKETKKLNEIKRFMSDMKQNNNKILKKKLINKDLHPVLNHSIQNAYGLIQQSNSHSVTSKTSLNRDKADYNLIVPTNFEIPYNEADSQLIGSPLPSLSKSKQISLELQDTVTNILNSTHKADLKTIFNDK